MIAALRRFADGMLGRGEATVTVPSFDGALKPNQRLETAERVGSFDAAEDLASDGQNLYLASGEVLLSCEAESAREIRRFDCSITALCALPGGGIAVALDGREVRVFADAIGAGEGVSFGAGEMNAINALAPGANGTLLATDGSRAQPYAHWAYDLMEKGSTGRVLSLDLSTRRVTEVANGLAFAFGVCWTGNEILVSESWRHRVV